MFLRNKNKLKKAAAQWKIEAGPRVKSLATEHLEYIVYALLEKTTQVIFKKNNKNQWTASIHGKIFNIFAILNSGPDFEQFIFNEAQLDSYVSKNDQKELRKLSEKSHPQCNPAEVQAVRDWTTSLYFRPINYLLRYFAAEEELRENLLRICIASHGLSKPLSSSSYSVSDSFRLEDPHVDLQERQKYSESKLLFTNRGFTAASSAERKSHRQKTFFFQPVSWNPIGKSIAELSLIPSEKEILFPPNTEFIYLQDNPRHWLAHPVRSANPRNQKPYEHGFSSKELTEILQHKEKLKWNSLIAYVKKELKSFKGSQDAIHYFKMVVDGINTLASNQSINLHDLDKMIHTIQKVLQNRNASGKESIFRGKTKNIETALSNTLHIIEDIRDKLFRSNPALAKAVPVSELRKAKRKATSDVTEESNSHEYNLRAVKPKFN